MTRAIANSCSGGSKVSIRTISATRCSAVSLTDPKSAPYNVDSGSFVSRAMHGHLDRQPEGRRRQDNDGNQSRRGLRPPQEEDPPHRPRPAGQQHDVVPRHHDGRALDLRRVRRSEHQPGGCDSAVEPAEPVGRAFADCAGEARGAAGGRDRLAFQAEGSAGDCRPDVRCHRHRLSAGAWPADGQRARGVARICSSRFSRRTSRSRARTTCSRRSRRSGRGPTRRCGSSAS